MGGREKERERNVNVWLPLTCHPFGTGPATQVCAFTGNQISDPLLLSSVLSPLSHTSQDFTLCFKCIVNIQYILLCILSNDLGELLHFFIVIKDVKYQNLFNK